MTVVVLGDANVDLEIRLPVGGGNVPHENPEPRLFGGGSAANTAAALAKLDVACRFVGAVGDDGYGRSAVASLAEADVDTSWIVSTPEEPTVMVIVVVAPDGERLIYAWPPSGGAHGLLPAERAVEALADASWLHVSGICLRVSPAREAILGAMEHAQREGIPVSFDLNLRLENWGWDDRFRKAVRTAVDRSDVVLGSAREEIAPLAGIDDPAEAAAALAGEQRLVIARLGAAGVVACAADGRSAEPSFEVVVEDTVGAGDAFNAGFIAARLGNADVGEALRWGNAVAALTITNPGARSTPSMDDVRGLLDR